MIPQNYDEWVKCITEGCKIPLTVPYVRERIEALNDRSNKHTKRYIGLYGEDYHAQVVSWFERALEEQGEGA